MGISDHFSTKPLTFHPSAFVSTSLTLLKLRDITPIPFELSDGRARISVPPLTRGQMRRLYALEREEAAAADPKLELSDLREKRLQIMLESGKPTSGSGAAISVQEFLDLLHPEEEIDILTGMVAKFHGIEVQHAVDLAAALRDIQKKKLQLNPEDVTSC